VPMFFMGEEVGCVRPYRFDDFLENREDFDGLREGEGAKLFGCYSALLKLRRSETALRAGASRVLFSDDGSRVLAFQRRDDRDEFVVVGTLSNSPFNDYVVSHPSFGDSQWREVFNSDEERFGGGGLTNAAGASSQGGALRFSLPANAVLVFKRVR
jgi:1,4-alpha-glucan branching enzyme